MMKRKKILCTLLSCVLAFTLFWTIGLAQPPESEVNIEFEEGDTVVNPVDPDDPSKPLEPETPGTGQSGPLTLNYVSQITFGKQKISGATRAYNAKTSKPFIQVSDLRGTGAGWRVEAECSEFTNPDEEVSLKGAVLTLKGGYALSANPELTPPMPAATVALNTDGETIARVVTANPNQGLGTWVIRWYPSVGPDNDNVQLTVLAGTATTEVHKATISWRLINAP